jgi:hypothetical protein
MAGIFFLISSPANRGSDLNRVVVIGGVRLGDSGTPIPQNGPIFMLFECIGAAGGGG